MDYNFREDLKAIREILELSQQELARQIDVQQTTISRSELKKTVPTKEVMEKVYNFAHEKKIQLNLLKEMSWKEKLNKDHILLFHGSKDTIIGKLSNNKGRSNNDFGLGFYARENFQQASSFVVNFDASSVYLIDFDKKGLKGKKYDVDQDWMMTIAYYRGSLEEYKDHPIIKNLIKESEDCDYIVAPIADNRMFQIIDSFIQGEITDEQCKHCLAATNLGYQYVFKSDLAISHLKLLERCYLSRGERNHYRNIKSSEVKLGEDKIKLAKKEYRGKGKYIDEILN